MVDFNKLRASKKQPIVIDPNVIFQRLPRPVGINDLYASQAQVLDTWFKRRNERDIVIKLHTGGGKTLVGLLIAQSIMYETQEPVIYLSPTVQLVQQILKKAKEYGISAIAYEKGTGEFPEEFYSAKSVLICTYQALFNGCSRFGIRDSGKVIRVAGIILDDAHVAFSTVRDSFTLEVEKNKDSESYSHLTNVFRNDFKALGRLGTFDDVVKGGDASILEVPYWSWKARSDLVREYLSANAEDYVFQWPLLRDSFEYCHCLISQSAIVITPIFPLVDLIPTFVMCHRRVYMSATIGDDSAIIRTFDADHRLIANPITSNSVAGISERMILVPQLMKAPIEGVLDTLPTLAEWAVEKQHVGTVILVSSASAAREWQNVGVFADSTEKVATIVEELQDGKSFGPFIFANRYDGIDLPGPACRLLIISGLPRSTSEYEQYRANVFWGGAAFNSALAQRIEQGMGRGARGAGDYCVVILLGKKLVSWLGRSANSKFLTSSSLAQIKMGMEVSENITSKKDLFETIYRCFIRDKAWTEYHAQTLAENLIELAEHNQINLVELEHAHVERKAFGLFRDGYFEQAIAKLDKFCQEKGDLDQLSKGWLLQFAARIAHYWGRNEIAQKFQQQAYANNHNLMRPQSISSYLPLTKPGKQAEAIVREICQFQFRRGFIAEFEEEVSHLVPNATSNQFEQALANLGSMLGFRTERPENTYGKGPDVLWLLDDNLGLVIEAKSRKNSDNALTKEQHGQLLNAAEWFHEKYPSYACIRVSLHPNVNVTKSTVPGESKALTLNKLNTLIADARALFVELCESVIPPDELIVRCENLLDTSTLKPNSFIEEYLVSFDLPEN